jgi:hypothetical protein
MSTDQPNPALLAAARAYAEATWDYDGPYRTSRDRENHIGADAASTAERPWFAALWEAGIAEGRRQAVELVSSLLGHDLVLDRAADVDSVGFLSSAIVAAREQGRRQATEGWEREWGVRDKDGYVFREQDEGEAHRLAALVADAEPIATVVSRLASRWEPAEQPETPGTASPWTDVTEYVADEQIGTKPASLHFILAEPASGGVVEPPKPPADTSWIRTTDPAPSEEADRG